MLAKLELFTALAGLALKRWKERKSLPQAATASVEDTGTCRRNARKRGLVVVARQAAPLPPNNAERHNKMRKLPFGGFRIIFRTALVYCARVTRSERKQRVQA